MTQMFKSIFRPGYEPYDVSDASHVEWGYVVSDIFFTGLIGLGVDGIDGAMFEHSNKMVSAHLESISGPIASVPVSPALMSPAMATAAPAASIIPTAAHASDLPK